MNKPIKFRHRYHKLAQPQFTTIRGKAKFKQIKTNDVLEVETPDENFSARVVGLELKRVADMELSFLKLDAEYPGCVISEHRHFVNLLNSFRAPCWAQVTLESELTILTLRRI